MAKELYVLSFDVNRVEGPNQKASPSDVNAPCHGIVAQWRNALLEEKKRDEQVNKRTSDEINAGE